MPVYTLDGAERIADPVIPPYAHPNIVASGEGSWLTALSTRYPGY